MRFFKAFFYWLVSLTYGGIMTGAGLIFAVAMLCTGHRPKRYKYNIYFEVGNNWGGCNLGAFIAVNKNPGESLLSHEAGHGLQNLMLGFLMPFVIAVPSFLRYHYRASKIRRGKGDDLPPYDSIWFESWATHLGSKYFLSCQMYNEAALDFDQQG